MDLIKEFGALSMGFMNLKTIEGWKQFP